MEKTLKQFKTVCLCLFMQGQCHLVSVLCYCCVGFCSVFLPRCVEVCALGLSLSLSLFLSLSLSHTHTHTHTRSRFLSLCVCVCVCAWSLVCGCAGVGWGLFPSSHHKHIFLGQEQLVERLELIILVLVVLREGCWSHGCCKSKQAT